MSEDFRRIALVEDNRDPEQLGRVRVRIYPEFESLEQGSLPWAEPSIDSDLCIKGDNKTGAFSIPEQGSFIVVDIDPTWQEFHYTGLTPNRKREDVHTNITDELKNLMDTSPSYPQPLYLLRTKDGVIAYHNTDTGEMGIVNKEGVYLQYDREGSFLIGKKDGSNMKLTKNGELTFEGQVNEGGSMVLYDPLKEILEKLLTHIHIAPNGPTQPAQDSSGSPLSTLKSNLTKMETK